MLDNGHTGDIINKVFVFGYLFFGTSLSAEIVFHSAAAAQPLRLGTRPAATERAQQTHGWGYTSIHVPTRHYFRSTVEANPARGSQKLPRTTHTQRYKHKHKHIHRKKLAHTHPHTRKRTYQRALIQSHTRGLTNTRSRTHTCCQLRPRDAPVLRRRPTPLVG